MSKSHHSVGQFCFAEKVVPKSTFFAFIFALQRKNDVLQNIMFLAEKARRKKKPDRQQSERKVFLFSRLSSIEQFYFCQELRNFFTIPGRDTCDKFHNRIFLRTRIFRLKIKYKRRKKPFVKFTTCIPPPHFSMHILIFSVGFIYFCLNC